MAIDVARDEALDGLHRHFRAAVAVGEGHGTEAVVHAPVLEELCRHRGCKFWAAI